MLYISPPFGNYFTYKDAIPVRGTFTLLKRPGLIYHTLRSLRPVRGGWRNQIGFRNCGISNVTLHSDCVYSICGLSNTNEWRALLRILPQGTQIEMNLSCPNVRSMPIDDITLSEFTFKFPSLIVKIRYDSPNDMILRLADLDVQTIHTSNTIPISKGGVSGRQLKEVNIPAVERIAKVFKGKIIAGGGIYNSSDVIDYRNAGATDYSISTVYISRPWNIKSIYEEANRFLWP